MITRRIFLSCPDLSGLTSRSRRAAGKDKANSIVLSFRTGQDRIPGRHVCPVLCSSLSSNRVRVQCSMVLRLFIEAMNGSEFFCSWYTMGLWLIGCLILHFIIFRKRFFWQSQESWTGSQTDQHRFCSYFYVLMSGFFFRSLYSMLYWSAYSYIRQ